jgi:hypothetical protein
LTICTCSDIVGLQKGKIEGGLHIADVEGGVGVLVEVDLVVAVIIAF